MIVDAWPEPLLAAAHPDRGRWAPRLAALVADVDPVGFCALAVRAAVLPVVTAAIVGCAGAPEELRTVIAEVRRIERDAQERVVAGLIGAVRRLNAAGVAHVACKGPVLGVIAVGDAYGRAYRDADVLVRPRDLARARELAGDDVDVADRLAGLEGRGFDEVLADAGVVDVGGAVVAASRPDHLRLAAARVGDGEAVKLGRLLDVARLIDGMAVDRALADEPAIARAIVAVGFLGPDPAIRRSEADR